MTLDFGELKIPFKHFGNVEEYNEFESQVNKCSSSLEKESSDPDTSPVSKRDWLNTSILSLQNSLWSLMLKFLTQIVLLIINCRSHHTFKILNAILQDRHFGNKHASSFYICPSSMTLAWYRPGKTKILTRYKYNAQMDEHCNRYTPPFRGITLPTHQTLWIFCHLYPYWPLGSLERVKVTEIYKGHGHLNIFIQVLKSPICW